MGRSWPWVLTGPVCVGLIYSDEDKGDFWPGIQARIQGCIFLCYGLSSCG
ncbi:UNVERIFIED_CONTAM: hypothetical protein FKN15_075810 [Acipenser sinensis]